jgi:hypothetical protein
MGKTEGRRKQGGLIKNLKWSLYFKGSFMPVMCSLKMLMIRRYGKDLSD